MCNINDRIKQIFADKCLNMSEVERACGFKPQTFSTSLRRGSVIGADKISAILAAYPDISAEWLMTGNGQMFKGDDDSQPQENIKGKVVKFYSDLPVSAGDIEQYLNDEDSVGVVSLTSGMNGAQGLFPVVGCSMLPTIKPGDWVGIKEVDHMNGLIDPDKLFMIITRDNQRMIKHIASVNHQEGYVTLSSDNSAYKPFAVQFDMIVKVYQIVCHLEML